MPARSIASLTISFGLVSIPVKLYSATQASGAISFNLLHKDCGSRLKQQYICIKEDVIVERSDMIKGYEFAKDQYVTFTPEELKEMEEKGTSTIEITEFVPSDTIDPVYYDKAYYLGPDKGGTKPYALLTAGMRQTSRSALARYAARGKQYIVQIRPVADGLVMQQLLYADEVRTIADVGIEKAEVKEAELKLAVQLIDQISVDQFDPATYQDDVKKRVQMLIEKKIEGEQISISTSEPAPAGQVIDLMQALRESVAKAVAAKPSRSITAPAEPRKAAKRATAQTAQTAERKKVSKR